MDREAIWLSGYATNTVLYNWIAAINQIRNQAIYADSTYITYNTQPVYQDLNTIAIRKGVTGKQMISVFSNLGAGGATYSLGLSPAVTGYAPSFALIEITTCTAYTTDAAGYLSVAMTNGLPTVFYPLALLAGSGICSGVTGLFF